ncbi:Asd/ArgC dimerization domain-containing protein [Micromonospora sp. M12]
MRFACSPPSAPSGVGCAAGRGDGRPGADPEAFDGVDVAMFDVPDEVSAEWAPIAVTRGAIAVDNSGAFRMDRDVPLVVPEINPEQVRNRPRGIIANANCTTLAMIVAVAPCTASSACASWCSPPTRRSPEPVRPAPTSCTTSSPRSPGTGRSARVPATSARRSATTWARFRPAGAQRGALGRLPGRRRLVLGGMKIRNESRKILGLPDLKVSATCVRVPVVTAHSVAVHAVFATEVDAEGAREALRNAPGSSWSTTRGRGVPDADRRRRHRPVLGRPDPPSPGRPRALDFFVTGDNLRKGAALNTAQIAELLAKELRNS